MTAMGIPFGRLGRQAAGVLHCLVIVAGIDGARRSGLTFPIPFLLLYRAVVATGALGGKVSGVLSDLLAAAFVVYAGFQVIGRERR